MDALCKDNKMSLKTKINEIDKIYKSLEIGMYDVFV